MLQKALRKNGDEDLKPVNMIIIIPPVLFSKKKIIPPVLGQHTTEGIAFMNLFRNNISPDLILQSRR